MNTFEFFLALVFVHLVFDFCLQTDFIATYKQRVPFVMGVHCFVWTYALCWTCLHLRGSLPLFVPIFLFIGHWVADYGKILLLYGRKKEVEVKVEDRRVSLLFHGDQIIHLLQLLIVVVLI